MTKAKTTAPKKTAADNAPHDPGLTSNTGEFRLNKITLGVRNGEIVLKYPAQDKEVLLRTGKLETLLIDTYFKD